MQRGQCELDSQQWSKADGRRDGEAVVLELYWREYIGAYLLRQIKFARGCTVLDAFEVWHDTPKAKRTNCYQISQIMWTMAEGQCVRGDTARFCIGPYSQSFYRHFRLFQIMRDMFDFRLRPGPSPRLVSALRRSHFSTKYESAPLEEVSTAWALSIYIAQPSRISAALKNMLQLGQGSVPEEE